MRSLAIAITIILGFVCEVDFLKYPLWAFMFLFIIPPFTFHAYLVGKAEFVTPPKIEFNLYQILSKEDKKRETIVEPELLAQGESDPNTHNHSF